MPDFFAKLSNCKYGRYCDPIFKDLLYNLQSQVSIDQAIQVAIQKSSVFHKMHMVSGLFEEGSLKARKGER